MGDFLVNVTTLNSGLDVKRDFFSTLTRYIYVYPDHSDSVLTLSWGSLTEERICMAWAEFVSKK